MANIIRVSPERLRSAAGLFSQTANSIKSTTSQMTQIVTNISGRAWSGEAASAYKSKYTGLQDDINRLVKMVNDHSQHLTSIATEYARAETENASQANSLSGDVIA